MQVKVHGVLLIESGAAEAIILNGRLKQQLQNDVRRRGWPDLSLATTAVAVSWIKDWSATGASVV
ncbi:MAG: hypothetical protein J0H25_14415, partial [Rhizobiales bacterium]|nr:hypothetical protein [Hyphomicrobiales bacterium]